MKRSRLITRRQFLATAAASAGVFGLTRRADAVRPIHLWQPEDEDYYDPVTGVRIRVLSPGPGAHEALYFTDPMWVYDMGYLVFMSDRTGARLPWARQMGSGLVRPLTTRRTDAVLVRPKQRDLILIEGRKVYRQYFQSAFQKLTDPMYLCELPVTVASFKDGLSMDADGETLYAGVEIEPDLAWGVWKLSPRSLQWRPVVTVDFPVGHVQAHPTIRGFILFCHETGGDAPQRTWIIHPKASEAVPFYREWYGEWVTHESWWGDGRALFTIWPYDDERLKSIYGIVSVNIHGMDLRAHARYPAWHAHGSPDGKWIVGDDFDRNLWLIHPGTGERRLLTQGHDHNDFKPHPHASFAPDSKAIVFNSARAGRRQVMALELPPWDQLPKT